MSDGERDPGMSSTAKVVIALSAAGVVGLALCCGGAYWTWTRATEAVGEFADALQNAATQNPEEIRDLTDSMVSIDIPEGWQPVSGMQWNLGVEMTMTTYSPNQPDRMLMLMQTKGDGVDQQQMEQQMEQQMRMQGGEQGLDLGSGAQSSETRTFMIDGEERSFQFIVSTGNTGNKTHQVMGMFPGRNGVVMLTMVEDDANWDEEAVVRMIESITTQTTTGTNESSEAAPEATEAAPESTETAPEATETAPEATETAPEATDTTSRTTETPPETTPQ